MGTYNKGILGPFSGKVGTVVGASWRGKDVLRSLPRQGSRTPSEVQMLQRLKFLTVNQFLTPINPVLGKFYGSNNGDKTRINQAMSYHLKEAVTFIDPIFVMDYMKVQISKGDLLGVQTPTVVAVGGNEVKYSWDDNSGQGQASATDVLLVVIYAPSTNLYFYTFAAAQRSANSATIILPTFFNGVEVQSWIAFTSSDEKLYSTSVYMGAITVT